MGVPRADHPLQGGKLCSLWIRPRLDLIRQALSDSTQALGLLHPVSFPPCPQQLNVALNPWLKLCLREPDLRDGAMSGLVRMSCGVGHSPRGNEDHCGGQSTDSPRRVVAA